MSNASEQRIRHVAIVLQSLDANTSRGLLAQLSPEQSKRVRQAMVKMGTVTPHEREAAFRSMQGLLKAANIRTQPDRTTPSEPPSPATALLSQNVTANDQFEFSPEAVQQDRNTTGESYAELPFNRYDGNWHHMQAEVLADILQGERPIVIATVLNQVSVERATAISQALPLPVAAATLAALPHLHLTDAAILRDIQTELERKIGQYQAPKQVNAEGLAKLQAIVSSMPASQQGNWTKAIAQSNPLLATKLGWSTPSGNLANSVDQQTNKQSIHSISNEGALESQKRQFANATTFDAVSNFLHPQTAENDIFTDSMILPFPGPSNPKSDHDAIENKQNVAPKSDVENSRLQTLDDLLHFSDRDFVSVLHACQPQTVLLALSGAAKPFVARVEKLMPAKDAKRLRERLNSLGPIQLRDVDAAQKNIAETAMKMIANGLIAVTASVSFTAAA